MQQQISPDQIKTMLDSAQERLAEVADSVQILVRRLGRVDEALDPLEFERQRFEEGPSPERREVRRFKEKIDEIESELDDVEAAVEELQTNSAELANGLSDIQSTITTLEEQIRGQVTAAPPEDVLETLAELSQRLGRLGADRAVKIERKLGAARQRITSARDRVEALKAPLGVSEEPGESDQGEAIVRGTVREQDGSPAVDRVVQLVDKRIGGQERTRGQASTNSDGRYEIQFTMNPEETCLAYVVRVIGEDQEPEVESDPIYEIKPEQVVDLMIGGGEYPGLSEFERTLGSIESCFVGEGAEDVSPGELTNEDIEIIAGSTGVATALLEALRAAFRLSTSNQVSSPIFYGLIRHGLPDALPELLQESLPSMRRALEVALEENLIPMAFRNSLEHELELLRELRVDEALQTRPTSNASSSLGDILQTTLTLSSARQRTIADLLTNGSLSREKLVETLIQEHGFSESEAAEATDTLERAEITLGHAPLMARVRDTSLRDLSGDPITWRQMIDELDDQAVPPIIQGDNEEVRKDRYAHVVARAVERKFPTRVFGERLASDQEFDLPQREQVAAFLSREQDFDLSGLPIRRYLAENDPDLDDVGDIDSFIQGIEGCQRVHRLGAGFDGCKALYSEGLTSGWAISQQSPTQFRTRFQGEIDPREADAIYDNALHKVASTQALLTDFNELRNGVLPRALKIDVDFEDDSVVPELRNLFGPLDFCECKHCRSVLSPAAYLVDVLRFLDERKPTDGRTPLEVLSERRPDIQKIELNCENTNTLVPYIDLVNEILEQEVLRRRELSTSDARQTTRTSEELRVYPEHLDATAYQVLREITDGSPPVYPWVLPFDLWAEETRAYLAHLDVDRGTLLEEFRHVNEPEAGYPDKIDVAAEQLGLTRTWWDIIAGDTGIGVTEFWNVRTDADLETLETVSTFLNTARMDYSQLLELLDTDFVHPDPESPVEVLGEQTCNTKEMRLRNLNEAALDRMHRFLRLQRHLGWSMKDLDEAIQLLGAGDLDTAFLRRLAALHRASEELDQSREELIRLWRADIPRTRREESLGEILNLGIRELRTTSALLGAQPLANGGVEDLRAVARLAMLLREADFTVAELDYLVNADPELGLEVEPAAAAITEVLEDLRQGLRKIQEETRIPADPSADRVKQWLTALNWPENLGAEVASQLAASPLTPEIRASLESRLGAIAYETELDSLPPEIVFPDDLAVRMRYDGQARLREDGATGVLRFAGPPNEEDRERLLDLAAGLGTGADDYRKAINRIFDAAEVPELRIVRWLDADGIASLLMETDLSERLISALDPLSDRLRKVRSEAFLTQRLAEALGLAVETTQRLLDTYARLDGSPVLDVFLPQDETESLARTNPDVEIREDEDRFVQLFEAYRKLHRAALVISRFGLSVDDLEWLYDSSGPIGLNALPPPPDVERIAAVDEWARLAELMDASQRHLGDDDSLRHILSLGQASGDAFDEEEVRLAISAGTGWHKDDITTLHASLDLQAGDYPNGQALVRLGRAFRRLARTDLPEGSVEDVPEFDGPDRDRPVEKLDWFLQAIPAAPEAAQRFTKAIRKTLETNHDPEKWPEIGQQLRDPLREKQLKALREYLLAQGPPSNNPDATWSTWDTTRDLHDYFLVDVEMTSCMMTSRIKLAHSSVQLFVQRSLMNLEPGVKAVTDPSEAERRSDVDEDWLQWDWMKNYRVWEANRKVFLWPENWLLLGQHVDKSPFFEEQENDLLQEDITEETAESAFVNYMEKLNTVARLEVCGMVKEDGDGPGKETLHIIGRTRTTARTYFYRRREKNQYGARWTPWQKVDVDIEGDYLIPVIWHRRLYLFWPTFRKKTEQLPIEMPGKGEQMPESPKYSEMRLAWSRYKNGAWSEKQESEGLLYGPPHDISWFVFSVEPIINGELTIIVRSHLRLRVDPVLVERIKFLATTTETSYEAAASWLVPGLDRVDYLVMGLGDDQQRLSARTAGDDQSVLRETQNFLAHNPEGISVRFWRGDFRLSSPHARVATFQSMSDEPDSLLELSRDYYFTGDKIETRKAKDFRISRAGMASKPLVLDFQPEDSEESFSVLFGKAVDLLVSTPFFLDDDTRTFFAEPAISEETRALLEEFSGTLLGEDFDEAGGAERLLRLLLLGLVGGGAAHLDMGPRFHTHYHPFAQLLLRELSRFGVGGVLNRRIQTKPADVEGTEPFGEEQFVDEYGPNPDIVKEPYPTEKINFSSEGAYSSYNWEVFFHAPFLIADQLSQNQRFEEAQKWFHYIFDPTDTSDNEIPQRYWITKPFHERTRKKTVRQRIEALLRQLAEGTEDPELANQIEQWRDDPFNPHLIARLRTVAYQKAVVMKYLDNLIAWGDYLFRQDTIESINEATQVYMLAAEILGPPPQEVEWTEDVAARTFEELKHEELDEFGNALVAAETYAPGSVPILPLALPMADEAEPDLTGSPLTGGDSPFVSTNRFLPERARTALPNLTLPLPSFEQRLYFCIPQNKKLLGYWDTVADRLFKIRHCMNIEGVVRRLPLFEPPIEPGLLVRAAARGMDVRSALRDIGAALPHYRFRVMIRQAIDFCDHVRSFGSALQAAMEKRDAEELSQLRAVHELRMQEQIEEVRRQQIEVAKEELQALGESRRSAQERRDYYAGLKFMNVGEETSLKLQKASRGLQITSASLSHTAAALHGIPDAKIGSPTTVGVTTGGQSIGSALQAASSGWGTIAGILASKASSAATRASYERRAQNWDFQKRQAERDIERIDSQIEAAQLRVEIAQQQLRAHETQIENAKEIHDLMTEKFSNHELYRWRVGQISSVYFQAYELLLEVSRGAEKAYQYELGVDETFVTAGYWENLYQGLGAADKCRHDLKRMEASYFRKNRRQYELTKHVSLRLLDPLAFLQLKEAGTCIIELPEAIFDMDFPGHYMRRIKSVSLTIPAITGPYTGVNCTLTLLGSATRKVPEIGEGEDKITRQDGAVESIATSSGLNDSGLFQLNFQDERYLPFEGAGAVSTWRLEVANAVPQFDWETASDCVMHMSYTARSGGKKFREDVVEQLFGEDGELTDLFQLFSARNDFPDQWNRLIGSTSVEGVPTLELDLSVDRFPYFVRDRMEIHDVELFLDLEPDVAYPDPTGETLHVIFVSDEDGRYPGDPAGAPFVRESTPIQGMPWVRPVSGERESPGSWRIEFVGIPETLAGEGEIALNGRVVRDLLAVVGYSVSGG